MHRYEVPETNFHALKEKIDSVDIMAAIGHEIRNPLNTIIGISQLLNASSSMDEMKAYGKDLVQTSDHLMEIVNNLMDFSKLRSGRVELNLKSVNFREGLLKYCSAPMAVAKAKGLEFVVDIDKELPVTVVLDTVKLSQVLMNLVSNAVKFTTSGKVTVGVKLLVRKNEALRVLYWVEDTGLGISQENLQKIFKPFHQGDENTNFNHGGTGLGLTICKQLVEMMGGKFTVDSALGNGSRFSFVLNTSTGTSTEENSFQKPSREALKGLKVLVVDDSPLNRMVAQRQLESMEMTCSTAHNGIEALELLEQQEFDFLFTDLRMPEMGGFELLKQLREKNWKYRDLPVVALTGSLQGQQEEDLIQFGFSDFLLKPFRPEELLEKIKKLTQVPVA